MPGVDIARESKGAGVTRSYSGHWIGTSNNYYFHSASPAGSPTSGARTAVRDSVYPSWWQVYVCMKKGSKIKKKRSKREDEEKDKVGREEDRIKRQGRKEQSDKKRVKGL